MSWDCWLIEADIVAVRTFHWKKSPQTAFKHMTAEFPEGTCLQSRRKSTLGVFFDEIYVAVNIYREPFAHLDIESVPFWVCNQNNLTQASLFFLCI